MERKEYPRPSYLQSGAKLEGGMGGGVSPKYESSGLAGQSKILNNRM
jgi:hypothetical protein